MPPPSRLAGQSSPGALMPQAVFFGPLSLSAIFLLTGPSI